jgi:hypothetical protein
MRQHCRYVWVTRKAQEREAGVEWCYADGDGSHKQGVRAVAPHGSVAQPAAVILAGHGLVSLAEEESDLIWSGWVQGNTVEPPGGNRWHAQQQLEPLWQRLISERPGLQVQWTQPL